MPSVEPNYWEGATRSYTLFSQKNCIQIKWSYQCIRRKDGDHLISSIGGLKQENYRGLINLFLNHTLLASFLNNRLQDLHPYLLPRYVISNEISPPITSPLYGTPPIRSLYYTGPILLPLMANPTHPWEIIP